MRIARLFAAAAGAAVVLSAPAGAQGRARVARETGEQAREATERLRAAVEVSAERTARAYNAGDITGFIQPYAPEIWIFPPNAEPFQGRAAADDFFARSYRDGTRNLELKTTGLERDGALAYETGTYSIDYPTPGGRGAMSRDYGKYVHVWKRGEDGVWRVHLATWSSNLQPAQMAR